MDKKTKELFAALYDMLVYLTCNYSSMPEDFKSRFSETNCVVLRQSLFTRLYDNEDYE